MCICALLSYQDNIHQQSVSGTTRRLRALVQLLMTYTRLGVRFSQLNQEPKASILLHHVSQISLTQIKWSCRPLRALTLCSRLSKNNAPRASTLITALHKMHKPTESDASQNVSAFLFNHGSPKVHNTTLNSTLLCPIYPLPLGHGLLARNPGRRCFCLPG